MSAEPGRSFAEKYTGPRRPVGPARMETDSPCFSVMGVGRGSELMLDIRQRNGNRVAFPYAYLTRVRFDPSEGIMLEYTGCHVVVRGRNLAALYDALVFHRVTWIAELDDEDTAGEGTPIVDGVRIEDLKASRS